MGTSVSTILDKYPSIFDSDFGITIQQVSIMFGCIISETFYSKFKEKHAITILWVFFSIAIGLISLLSLGPSVLFIFSANIGAFIFSVSLALLLIVEIGYITPYIKSTPNTYALSLLLALNQIPDCLYYLLYNIPTIWTLLIFAVAIVISVKITWGLSGNPQVYMNELSSRYIVLPFSAFAVEFYVVGVNFI